MSGTQEELSKLVTFNVLSQADVRASKIVTFNVLSQTDIRVSKLVTFLVLMPVVGTGTQKFLPCGLI
jgi:hypothetical protein